MQIDTVAMIQGIYDAQDDGKISDDLSRRLRIAISEISFPGPVKRSVCDYKKLLIAIADVDGKHFELSYLWQYLGKSLSSGISVGHIGPL